MRGKVRVFLLVTSTSQLSAVKSPGKLGRGSRFQTQEGGARSIREDMQVILKSVHTLLTFYY